VYNIIPVSCNLSAVSYLACCMLPVTCYAFNW
jgi:hypothetical protein